MNMKNMLSSSIFFLEAIFVAVVLFTKYTVKYALSSNTLSNYIGTRSGMLPLEETILCKDD